MKENGFTQKKIRSRRYPRVTITDADYADDKAQVQAKLLRNIMEQSAGGIGLHMNTDKT